MLVRWWRGLAAAAAAALWLGAAPAQAADLIKSGTELQYSSEGVETFGLSLTISGGTVTFNGDDPLTLGTGTGCTLLAGGQDATCPTAGITQLDVDTGVSTATGTNTLSTSDAITIEIDAAGGGGDDSLDGGGGGDTLAGAGGQDTLSGDAGTDTLTGAAGDDALAGGDGADTLSDTSGLDTITYVGRPTAITANLQTGTNGDADTYTGSFETLIGTSLNDSLTAATAVPTTLSGGSGEDTLNGGGQADTLIGGSDTDTLNGSDGDDLLIGSTGASADVHTGGNGVDTADYSAFSSAVTASLATGSGQDGDTYNTVENLQGGSGADTLTGNSSANLLVGNNGADTLIGGTGADTMRGGDSLGAADASADTVSYDDDRAAIPGVVSSIGGAHQDGDVYSDIQNLTGGDGDDTLTGDAAVNALSGGNGSDLLVGLAGADTLRGGSPTGAADASADIASYSERAVALTMTLPNTGIPDGDVLVDIQGLEGGSADDTITGDGAANVLRGGGGGDRLRGAGGADTVQGGPGTDTATYDERTAAQPVTVTLDGAPNDGAAAEGDLVGGDVESVEGGAGNDTLTGDAVANLLLGGAGNDLITGGAGGDDLQGATGDDTLNATDGEADNVDCGDDTDSAELDTIDTASGCETTILPPPPPPPPPPRPAAAAPRRVVISTDFAVSFKVKKTFTILTQLQATDLPAGSTLELTCTASKAKTKRLPGSKSKKGCPLKIESRSFPAAKANEDLSGLFSKRKLPVGAVVGLRATAPATIGKLLELKVRKKKAPSATTTCLPPSGSPTACP